MCEITCLINLAHKIHFNCNNITCCEGELYAYVRKIKVVVQTKRLILLYCHHNP